ncbi:MAG: rod shape-determining protein MreC [Lachnospiraceae bacterium]|nr:rod shape-determining protein MreC [Lachnospiraceae bacterium]
MSPVVQQKGEKFTFNSKYLLFILTILCTIFMILCYITDFSANALNYAVGFIVTPFEKGISETGYYLANRAEQIATIKELLAENDELKARVDELTVENTLLQQDKYELISLRELYNLDSEYSSYEMTGARVISRSAGNWYSTFIIDKGASDGIEIDMNVMAGGGLVGRVTATGAHWAQVKSIIDDDSFVSSQILSNSDILMVNGSLEMYKDGIISFSQLVDSDDEVHIGDKVVTSNISDKYLPGILIGYIDSINPDSNNITKSGTLTPAVDFEHISDVLVIMKVKPGADIE